MQLAVRHGNNIHTNIKEHHGLTKKDLVDLHYEQTGLPKKDCVSAVELIFEIIKDELEKGNPVKISGFGQWTVKSKRERIGRNPQTGDRLTIDARKVVTFKLSPVLRKELNAE
jgi:integration host factor subunit alpha